MYADRKCTHSYYNIIISHICYSNRFSMSTKNFFKYRKFYKSCYIQLMILVYAIPEIICRKCTLTLNDHWLSVSNNSLVVIYCHASFDSVAIQGINSNKLVMNMLCRRYPWACIIDKLKFKKYYWLYYKILKNIIVYNFSCGILLKFRAYITKHAKYNLIN